MHNYYSSSYLLLDGIAVLVGLIVSIAVLLAIRKIFVIAKMQKAQLKLMALASVRQGESANNVLGILKQADARLVDDPDFLGEMK